MKFKFQLHMALQRPVKTWALLALLLLLYHHHHCLAASGGRMGGSSFSSRSASTRAISSKPSSTGRYSVRTSSPDCESTKISNPVSPKSAYEFGLNVGCITRTFMAITFAYYLYLLLKLYSDKDKVKTSVVKLQVGLLGTARSLQRDLNRIAMTADTSGPDGFKYILHEATSALLRHPEYCISGYSSVDVRWVVEKSEQLFNQLSREERGKFNEETLVNVNNIRKQSSTRHGSNGVRNKYIVSLEIYMNGLGLDNGSKQVTIIVAACDVQKLPPIKNRAQLKEALQTLGSIRSSKIMAAEVLWTPQKENDSLTKRRVRQDFPLLHYF